MGIKILVMDVDGTLTDGKIYIGKDGEICKSFNIKDGYGIHDLLMPASILPVIITGRKSQIVENRCRELEITELYQGIHNKLDCLSEIIQKQGIAFNQVAYIGDDFNDIECMSEIGKQGGIIGCPLDAVDEVKNRADFISTKKGGDGAVREFIHFILDKR